MVNDSQKNRSQGSGTEEVKRIVENIEGWLSDREGEFLYQMAKKAPERGAVVEIGSWKGKSTIWLAKGSKSGNKAKVYAIDPHNGSHEHRETYGEAKTFRDFKRNIENARCGDLVIPIVKTSEEAAKEWDKPVGFLFIDGAHEYESVKLDFELWHPHVIEGGVVALHDTTGDQSEGPKKVVEEFIYHSGNFKDIGFVDSITFATKVGHSTIMW